MRNIVMWCGLAVILIIVNVLIFGKEKILRDGDVILLDLAPQDPRSIMQGDYMTLRYQLVLSIENAIKSEQADGHAVIRLGNNHLAEFVRIHMSGGSLATNERLLRFRMRGHHAQVATNAFYFQEGHAAIYSTARYGRFRLRSDGEVVITGLCNAQFKELKPPHDSDNMPDCF